MAIECGIEFLIEIAADTQHESAQAGAVGASLSGLLSRYLDNPKLLMRVRPEFQCEGSNNSRGAFDQSFNLLLRARLEKVD